MVGRVRQRLALFLGKGLGLVVTAALAAAPAFADDTQFPKGFRVGLVPPAGLALSSNFAGFEDPERKVAIFVLELPPQAYYEIEAMIFRENANLQIVVDHRELLPLASGIGVLVSGHAQIDGLLYRKWLLVTSGPDVTAVVRAQAPDNTKEAYPEAAIRASLASVALRPPPSMSSYHCCRSGSTSSPASASCGCCRRARSS